jgi:hypothetical protein
MTRVALADIAGCNGCIDVPADVNAVDHIATQTCCMLAWHVMSRQVMAG